jgi:hypothetical protein
MSSLSSTTTKEEEEEEEEPRKITEIPDPASDFLHSGDDDPKLDEKRKDPELVSLPKEPVTPSPSKSTISTTTLSSPSSSHSHGSPPKLTEQERQLALDKIRERLASFRASRTTTTVMKTTTTTTTTTTLPTNNAPSVIIEDVSSNPNTDTMNHNEKQETDSGADPTDSQQQQRQRQHHEQEKERMSTTTPPSNHHSNPQPEEEIAPMMMAATESSSSGSGISILPTDNKSFVAAAVRAIETKNNNGKKEEAIAIHSPSSSSSSPPTSSSLSNTTSTPPVLVMIPTNNHEDESELVHADEENHHPVEKYIPQQREDPIRNNMNVIILHPGEVHGEINTTPQTHDDSNDSNNEDFNLNNHTPIEDTPTTSKTNSSSVPVLSTMTSNEEGGSSDWNHGTTYGGGVEEEQSVMEHLHPNQQSEKLDLETIPTILPLSSCSITNTATAIESMPNDPLLLSSVSSTSLLLLSMTCDPHTTQALLTSSAAHGSSAPSPTDETHTNPEKEKDGMHHPADALDDEKNTMADPILEHLATPVKLDNHENANDLQIDTKMQNEQAPTNIAGITPSTIMTFDRDDDDSGDETPLDDMSDLENATKKSHRNKKKQQQQQQQRCKLFSSYWCWRGVMLLAVALAILSVLLIVFQTQLLSHDKNSNHDEDDSTSSQSSWNENDDKNTTTDNVANPTTGVPLPTNVPTLPSFGSEYPTPPPITAAPTFSPTFTRVPFVPNNITFATLGDAPYSSSQAEILREQMSSGVYWTNPNIPFLVHVGDIRLAGNARPCLEEEYILAADILRQSPVPVFIIPGTCVRENGRNHSFLYLFFVSYG